MASIIGEGEFRNATAGDLTVIDSQLAQARLDYANITAKYQECFNNKNQWLLYSCKKHQGMTWNQLGTAKKTLATKVETLTKQRDLILASISKNLQVGAQISEVTKESTVNYTKAILYGLLAIGLITGAFFLYKRYKK